MIKQELDDYRTHSKQFKNPPTKKDMMIKQLIDEVERQHKRITFLESKVKK